jgi:flagellar biosynthesis/type III secretory pathway protein FliH
MTPHTIDTPALIISEDAPHPQSYRPDLPLRSELAPSPLEEEREAELEEERVSAREEGYDEGRFDGKEDARRESAARVRELETENAALRAQLAQKAS